MAVAHYQFEAIHPFIDGNGRTGRVLNLLFLVDQTIARHPGPASQPATSSAQGRLLSTAPGGDHQGGLGRMDPLHAAAVQETAQWNHREDQGDPQLIGIRGDAIRRDAPKIYSRELVEMILSTVLPDRQSGRCRHRAAPVGLQIPQPLCEIGVLEEHKGGPGKAVHQSRPASPPDAEGRLSVTASRMRANGATRRPRSRAGAWKGSPRRRRCSPRRPR